MFQWFFPLAYRYFGIADFAHLFVPISRSVYVRLWQCISHGDEGINCFTDIFLGTQSLRGIEMRFLGFFWNFWRCANCIHDIMSTWSCVQDFRCAHLLSSNEMRPALVKCVVPLRSNVWYRCGQMYGTAAIECNERLRPNATYRCAPYVRHPCAISLWIVCVRVCVGILIQTQIVEDMCWSESINVNTHLQFYNHVPAHQVFRYRARKIIQIIKVRGA